MLNPNRSLLYQSDFLKPSPKSKRRGRKRNPNPRRWGRLSREDLGKLSPKEREDWGKLSLTERRELLLLIKEEAEQKEEIKQQHKKATKEQNKAHQQLLIREAEQPDASVTPNTTKKELSAVIRDALLISKAKAKATPNTTKEELSASPTEVHSSSDLWTCLLISPEDLGKLSPKEKENWDKLIKKVAEQREEMIRKAVQHYLSTVVYSSSVAPNTTKKELSASPTVVHSLSEITTTKEELLAPPTSEENPWQSILGCSEAEWIAELQSKGNICQICGHTNHVTLECSYLVEIPLDAKIVNESKFEIACKYCSMPLVTGACVNECLPPTRRKVIQKLDGWPFSDLPKKELFAPPSSEMVVHSSSEEAVTPCIHGLSSSSSLKLNGELHARATTPRFAFPDVPACIHGLSSSSSLKLNGEPHARATTSPFAFPEVPACIHGLSSSSSLKLHARATTKPFAFPDMPACKSNKSAFCFPDVPAMPDVKCQICGANHWSDVCSLVTENPTGCKSYQ